VRISSLNLTLGHCRIPQWSMILFHWPGIFVGVSLLDGTQDLRVSGRIKVLYFLNLIISDVLNLTTN